MSSESVRKKARQIISADGVKQVSPETFAVTSSSGSTYEVVVKLNLDKENKVESMQINNCSCPSWSLGHRAYCSHGDAVELFVLGKNSEDYYCHECQVAFSSAELLTQHLAEKQIEESK
jgi:hypothetical protein